jgi:hypothetical protein
MVNILLDGSSLSSENPSSKAHIFLDLQALCHEKGGRGSEQDVEAGESRGIAAGWWVKASTPGFPEAPD